MRASCSDTRTQKQTHTPHENENEYDHNNENGNKNKSDKNRVFQYDENRPEHSHGILDFVFTKLGHEAFSPASTSTSTSTSTSSSTLFRKNNSTPISILKGTKYINHLCRFHLFDL